MPNNIIVNGAEVNGLGQSFYNGDPLILRQKVRDRNDVQDPIVLRNRVGVGLIDADVLLLRQIVYLRSVFSEDNILLLRQIVRRKLNDQDQITLRQRVYDE